jgi:diguanylate cyclase (GGDEF)-like protein/PAS domain S-box-containing protein
VSKRQRTAPALRDRQRMLDTLLSNLPGMAYRCRNDPQWTMEFVSQGCFALTGYAPGDIVGNRMLAYADLIHPDDRAPVWESVQIALAEPRAFQLRYRIRSRDGEEKWVWEQGRGVYSDSGKLLALEGYVTDITAMRRAEADLAEREARYKALAEGVPDLLVRMRADGTYVDFKPAHDFQTYVPPERFLGKTPADVLPPAVAAEHLALLKRALESGRQQLSRYRLEAGGEPRDFEARIVPAGAGEAIAVVRDVTLERRGAEQIAKLASAVEQAADTVIVTDAAGVIQYVNPAFEQATGYSRAEALGRKPNLVKSDGHTAAFYAGLWETILRGEVFRDVFVNRHKDGGLYYEEKSITPLKDAEGRITHFVSVGKDITERRRQEGTIARLGRILDESSNEIYVFDAETLRFVQVNEGAQRNLGYSWDEMRALTPLDLKPEFDRASFERLLDPLRRGGQEWVSFVTSHRRKDGSLYPVEVRLQLSRAEQPPLFVAIVQDISERKRAEERLSYLAYYDTLTGLPNRALLHESLRRSLAEADRHGRSVAVMMLDLDRFKIINDTLGHAVGDGLLKTAGERLAGAVRPGDTVARLGGDEFALVLADVANTDDVAHVVRKILARFGEPVHVAGHELHVTPSIGITLYPVDGGDIDDLLRNADTAMYKAKERGRNNFQFFTAELNRRAERRLALENALHHALERGELFLDYQPQVALAGGRIVGCEALLRWRHPGLGLVPPLDFISVAEDTGLILPIGEWVLREACRALAAWQAAGHRDMRVAVNVSARQLHLQDFHEVVRRILAETGVAAPALEIEITEGFLLRDAEETLGLLRELGAHGVRFAIDDFGTGYSSLAYLKRLPLDTLKVDRTFVRDIAADPDDAAIVRAVIAMARSLEMEVIAEGVESAEQEEFLRAHGCHGAQGYRFGAPVAEEEIAVLLARQARGHAPAPGGLRA